MSLIMLGTADDAQWAQALGGVRQHDVYFTPAYHRVAEERGEGQARLLIYAEGCYRILLPILLRPIDSIEGLEAAGAGLWDASSVYGYGGPLASHADIPPAVASRYQQALASALVDMRVVSLFARLHPLIAGQQALLSGTGEVVPRWQTVSIDLALTPEQQVGGYRQSLRYDIRRLRASDLVCLHDVQGTHLAAFVDIYQQTMRRVGAGAGYFFEQGYFERLLANPAFALLVVTRDQQVVCGALFSLCDRICQYHLAGTSDAALRQAPMKLLIDEARLWAQARGARVLHLGGGLGRADDPLFRFKAGFSRSRHQFAVWRWALQPAVAARLAAARARANQDRGLQAAPDFFPSYRSPAVLPARQPA
jgi:hypothetical protein